MNRNVNISLVTMVLWASLMSLASAAETKIPFYVPSGATTEMSRMYYYMIKQFEPENPEIDVIFKPKQNWNELTNTLRKVKAVTGKPPFTLASEWYGWLFEAFVENSCALLFVGRYGTISGRS